MGTTRQSIIRGPGSVTFGGVTFYDASGITAEVDSSTSDVPSSMSGRLDTIKTDQVGKVSLTPVGNLSEALVVVLFPDWLKTPEIGRSVFGSADAPLVVHSRAGQKLTFLAAALTKCPDILLSPVLLRGKYIGGMKVDGPHMDAKRIVEETKADSVVIACELAPERLHAVVESFKSCGLKVSCFTFEERDL